MEEQPEEKLTLKWSRREKDLICHYPNPRDGAACFDAFTSERFRPISKVWSDSFVKELEKRGYDITTLKFSIKKKINP